MEAFHVVHASRYDISQLNPIPSSTKYQATLYKVPHHPLQSTTPPSSKYHTTLFKVPQHPLHRYHTTFYKVQYHPL